MKINGFSNVRDYVNISKLAKLKYQQHKIEQGKTKSNIPETERKKIEKVAKEFEAMFVSEVFKDVQKTIPDDNIINGGQAEKIFKGMLIEQYAKEGVKNDSLGLAKQLVKQIEEIESGKVKKPTHSHKFFKIKKVNIKI